MNVGKLYSYPRLVKDIWDNVEIGSSYTGHTLQRGETFVLLEEISHVFEESLSDSRDRTHLKILTMQGVVGWIFNIDKDYLVEMKS